MRAGNPPCYTLASEPPSRTNHRTNSPIPRGAVRNTRSALECEFALNCTRQRDPTQPTQSMKNDMNNATDKPGGWSAVRRQLATWEKPALLALLKDLYETAGTNRDFIHARCQSGENSSEGLEKYRSKIVEQFFPARGFGKLKLGEARKAIRDYRKATGNLPGTAELLLTYVENGTRFTHEYGDIDERFYSSVESALVELAALLRGEVREMYPQFRDRLASVEQMSDGIGWGFHDFISDVVWQIKGELGDL